MDTLESRRAFDLPRERVPAGGAAAGPHTLIGTWVNYDETSRGIVKLVITAAEIGPENGLDVRVFGAGDDSEGIDWDVARGAAFAGSVDGGDGVGFKAWYDFGFMETFVAAYLNLRLLVVDTYNTFKDDSGRSRYFMRDHFYQVD